MKVGGELRSNDKVTSSMAVLKTSPTDGSWKKGNIWKAT